MRKKIVSLVACWVVVVVTSACTCGTSYIEARDQRAADEIRAAKEQAEPILVAIDRYDDEHGHLPQQMESLLPTYLPAIPKTVAGQEFRYELHHIDGYYLCFDVVSKPSVGCCYYHRLEFWDCSMRAAH